MLDQVVPSRTEVAGVRHHLPHRIKLLETRKNQRFPYFGCPVALWCFLPVEVTKSTDNVEQNFPREDRLCSRLIRIKVCAAKFVLNIGIPSATICAAIERQEPGSAVLQPSRH